MLRLNNTKQSQDTDNRGYRLITRHITSPSSVTQLTLRSLHVIIFIIHGLQKGIVSVNTEAIVIYGSDPLGCWHLFCFDGSLEMFLFCNEMTYNIVAPRLSVVH